MDSKEFKLRASYKPFGGFGSARLLCCNGEVISTFNVVLNASENIRIHVADISGVPMFVLSVFSRSKEEAEAIGHAFLDTLDTLAFVQPVEDNIADDDTNMLPAFYFLCDAVELTSKSKVGYSIHYPNAVVNDKEFLGTIIGDVRCQKRRK